MDVIIIGSGAAGLVAAVAAHDAGARVLLVERADVIGGATAVSGGVMWMPLNHHMREMRIDDSRDDALAYCTRMALGRAPAELIEAFVDAGSEALAYLEGHTPLRCSALPMPDYHAELPGACRRRELPPPLAASAFGAAALDMLDRRATHARITVGADDCW